MRRTSNKEIQRIDAILRIPVRHRGRATDPAEIWRCTDVIASIPADPVDGGP